MREFIDKTLQGDGTPLNRENLMAIQGYEAKTITFSGNKIIEVNSKKQTRTITFNADGSIEDKFVGEKTITKRTSFSANGVSEVITNVE